MELQSFNFFEKKFIILKNKEMLQKNNLDNKRFSMVHTFHVLENKRSQNIMNTLITVLNLLKLELNKCKSMIDYFVGSGISLHVFDKILNIKKKL